MAINLSDNLLIQTAKPIDAKYGPYYGSGTSYALALQDAKDNAITGLWLPDLTFRFVGLTVGLILTVNGTVQPIVEYHFAESIGTGVNPPTTPNDTQFLVEKSGGTEVVANPVVAPPAVTLSTIKIAGIDYVIPDGDINGSGTIGKIPKWGSTTTSLTDSVIVEDSNNIGIGTSAPGEKLEVNGKIKVTGTADFITTTRSSATQANYIKFYNTATSASEAYIGFTSNNKDLKFSNLDSTGTLTFGSGGSTAISVDASQKVGIGITSPDSILTVRAKSADVGIPVIKSSVNGFANGFTLIGDNYVTGKSQFNLGISYSGANAVFSRSVKVSNTTDDVFLSSQDAYSTNPNAFILDRDGSFRFLNTATSATTAVGTAVSLDERMSIASSGNVGIGTTSPTNKLDVNGTVNLTNLKVSAAQGSNGDVLTSTGSGVGWSTATGTNVVANPGTGGTALTTVTIGSTNYDIASGTGTVTGTGTANKLTKWSAGGTGIEDSEVTDTGTLISLGEGAPSIGETMQLYTSDALVRMNAYGQGIHVGYPTEETDFNLKRSPGFTNKGHVVDNYIYDTFEITLAALEALGSTPATGQVLVNTPSNLTCLLADFWFYRQINDATGNGNWGDDTELVIYPSNDLSGQSIASPYEQGYFRVTHDFLTSAATGGKDSSSSGLYQGNINGIDQGGMNGAWQIGNTPAAAPLGNKVYLSLPTGKPAPTFTAGSGTRFFIGLKYRFLNFEQGVFGNDDLITIDAAAAENKQIVQCEPASHPVCEKMPASMFILTSLPKGTVIQVTDMMSNVCCYTISDKVDPDAKAVPVTVVVFDNCETCAEGGGALEEVGVYEKCEGVNNEEGTPCSGMPLNVNIPNTGALLSNVIIENNITGDSCCYFLKSEAIDVVDKEYVATLSFVDCKSLPKSCI